MSFTVFQGTSVLKVSATDPDIGINANLTYSIEGIYTHTDNNVTTIMLNLITCKCVLFPQVLSPDTTVQGLFGISETTGIISVSSEIDREKTGDVVVLTVKVPIFGFMYLQSWKPQRIHFTAKNKKCPERTLARTLKLTSSCSVILINAQRFAYFSVRHSPALVPVNIKNIFYCIAIR